MKMLVFSAYYEPEIAASLYLSINLYQDMAENGWDIDLFVPMPTRGVDDKTRDLYKKQKVEVKCNGKLKIHRISMMREGKNTILRAIRYLILNLAFIFKGLRTKSDVIFVQSTPPTQGAMGAILKKFKKVPLVYNLQDIFPDSLVNTGLTNQGSLLWKVGRLIEKFTYKNADKIIVISEDFKSNLLAKGVPEDKIEVVYNWVDENDVISIERVKNILIKKYNLNNNKFFITYCGNVGFTQNFQMIVEVAKDLEKYEDIQFVIIGDGAYSSELSKKIIENETKNIITLPFQHYDDIAHVFSLGDVGLIISKAGIGENSVPSKTWSIMSAQRAIIASFDINSELSKIVQKSKCGICVQADEKESLKTAILELYNDREKANQMGINGRKYILDNLTRKTGTEKLMKIIKKVVVDSAEKK